MTVSSDIAHSGSMSIDVLKNQSKGSELGHLRPTKMQ